MTLCEAICPPIFRSRTIPAASPGFIDTHIHYVQTGIIATPGKQLLQWVNDYVYPLEETFADETYARQVAAVFCNAPLRNGTTTTLVYCAVYSRLCYHAALGGVELARAARDRGRALARAP